MSAYERIPEAPEDKESSIWWSLGPILFACTLCLVAGAAMIILSPHLPLALFGTLLFASGIAGIIGFVDVNNTFSINTKLTIVLTYFLLLFAALGYQTWYYSEYIKTAL